jgi:PhnB protein
MAEVQPVPDGYPRVSPSLAVNGGAAAIEFYTTVFGFTLRMRMDMPDGRLGHAELELGDSVIMIADEFPDMGFSSPRTIGGTPVNFNIYVEDVDTTFAAALTKGATPLRPVENQFYGDRNGQVEDPFGHHWTISTRVEELSEEQLAQRAQEAMTQA